MKSRSKPDGRVRGNCRAVVGYYSKWCDMAALGLNSAIPWIVDSSPDHVRAHATGRSVLKYGRVRPRDRREENGMPRSKE